MEGAREGQDGGCSHIIQGRGFNCTVISTILIFFTDTPLSMSLDVFFFSPSLSHFSPSFTDSEREKKNYIGAGTYFIQGWDLCSIVVSSTDPRQIDRTGSIYILCLCTMWLKMYCSFNKTVEKVRETLSKSPEDPSLTSPIVTGVKLFLNLYKLFSVHMVI